MKIFHDHIIPKAIMVFYLFSLITLTSCKEDLQSPENCLLASIQYNSNNWLELLTISGGTMYQLKQYVRVEGETKLFASYQYKYLKDSVIIRDQLNAAKYRYPYITAKLDQAIPVQVVRYSPATEIRVVFDIDYTDPGLIIVKLTRVTNEGDRLLFAYGHYELDGNGNVVHVTRYRINTATFAEFNIYEDRYYTYDDYANPMKGLILPFFASATSPDIKFFSQNNPLTVTENNQLARYAYQYGNSNNTLSQIPPDGDPVTFSFLNCD